MKNSRIAKFASLRLIFCLLVLYLGAVIFALERPEDYSSNEEWKKARQAELQREIDRAVRRGATPSEITKIREKWVEENRQLEKGRTKAFKEFIKEVYGVSNDKAVEEIIKKDFEHSGTAPEIGQGRFGDIDFTPKPEAWKKIKDYAKKHPDKVKFAGGSVEIPGQEIVIHNPNKQYEYSVERGVDGKVRIVEAGKGGAPVKKIDTVALRAADKESYISYEFDKDGKIVIEDGASVGYDDNGNRVKKAGPKIADSHLNTLDNMKKIGKNFDDRSNFDYKKNQETAKATMRIIEGAYGTNPAWWPPEVVEMHKKCSLVKSGVALEELGIMDKQAKNEFYDRMEKVVKDAYAKTSAESAKKEAELAAKRDRVYREMEDLKKQMGEMKRSGDEVAFKRAQEELKQKKAEFENAQSKLYEYSDMKARAEHGVVRNKGGGLLLRAQGENAKLTVTPEGDIEIKNLSTNEKMSQSALDAKLIESRRKSVLNALRKPTTDRGTQGIVDQPVVGREAFFSSVGKLLDIKSAYEAGQDAGEAIDLFIDTNPTTKKSVQVITAGASLLALSNSARASTIGNIVAGAPGAIKGGATASIDELTKWYLENPNAGDPGVFESLKIGMRGANNFAKQYIKNTVYGLTIKPLVDAWNTAESGYKAFGAKLEEIDTIKQNRENREQMLSTADRRVFSQYRERFDDMENEAKRILNDKSASEELKKRAQAVIDEVRSARDRMQWMIDEEKLRDVSGEFVSKEKRNEDIKNRELTRKLFETSVANLEQKWSELEKIANSVRVKISVFDKDTGAPIDAEVSIVGANYRHLREPTRNGMAVFSDVPGGAYKINVLASGYDGKSAEYFFDPSKKKEYSGTFSLKKTLMDETPVYATLLVYVVDGQTGAPISGATIGLQSPDRGYSYSMATPTGAMEFPTLASGDYFASASAPGYSSKSGLRIPIDPAKNPNPRCRITLFKTGQPVDSVQGEKSTQQGFVDTSEIQKMKDLPYEEIHKRIRNVKCPICGQYTLYATNWSYATEGAEFIIYCDNCKTRWPGRDLLTNYDKIVQDKMGHLLEGVRKGGQISHDYNPPENHGVINYNEIVPSVNKENEATTKEAIRKQIEELRAEGNAKLEQIRAELKKLQGKPLKKTCQSCGFSGEHWWMGDRWSCPRCEKCTMPSEVSTSAGVYSKVRDEYNKKIAELEKKLK